MPPQAPPAQPEPDDGTPINPPPSGIVLPQTPAQPQPGPQPDDDAIPINPQSGIIMQNFLTNLERQGSAAQLDPSVLRFAKFVAEQLGTWLTTTPKIFAETTAGLIEVCTNPEPFLGPEFHEMAPVVQAVPADTLLQNLFAIGKAAYGQAFSQAAVTYYNENIFKPLPAAAPETPTPGGELNIQH